MNIPSFFFVMAMLSQQTTCDVDKGWMRTTLTKYFSAPRCSASDDDLKYKTAAMTFIRDQFREMGLEAHIQTFSAGLLKIAGANVIGLLKGRYFNTPDDSVVGIAAHYDTTRNTPGVNDNGAAMVAMLQAARELSKRRNRNSTILFLGFDFEEMDEVEDSGCKNGLCGSRELVRVWLPKFWPKTVNWNGIIVLDTILNFDGTKESQNFTTSLQKLFPKAVADSNGRRGDFLMITGRGHDEPLFSLFKKTWNNMGDDEYKIHGIVLPSSVANPATEASLASFHDFLRSSHTTFWLAGHRAVYLTDTADSRGYMKKCYRKRCDSLDHVNDANIGFVAKTTRTLISVVDTMAPADVFSGTAVQCTNHFVILPALLFFTFASF